MELMVIVAIMSVLSAIGFIYMNETLASSRDRAAQADARNLVLIVANNFLDKDGVDYMTTDGEGKLGGVYKLSPGVQISFVAGYDNQSYGDARMSSFGAILYHGSGTLSEGSIWNIAPYNINRRSVQVLIDEESLEKSWFVYP